MKYFPDMTSNIDNNIKEFQRKEKVKFLTKIFKKFLPDTKNAVNDLCFVSTVLIFAH